MEHCKLPQHGLAQLPFFHLRSFADLLPTDWCRLPLRSPGMGLVQVSIRKEIHTAVNTVSKKKPNLIVNMN